MNILIFSWRGPKHPNFGGAEIVTHQHARAWVAAGHLVTWFTSWFPGVPQKELIDGVQVIRRGNQIVSIQLAAVYWYVFAQHPKYDLVVDQFHGIPFFTPLFIQSKKLAFIHEVAKEVWWTNHLSFPFNYLYGLIGYLLEPVIFLLYKQVPFLTVSLSTKADLINWSIPPENITVIPNGVSTLPVEFPKRTSPTLIFLGAIAKDKGIEDALVVFSLLLQVNPKWQFWVVGKGEDKYLKSLHAPPNVKFWGFVNEQKKFELLAKAHVMLNPSHREGWGLVNIEANSVGTPVVAYNVPGCRDSIRDGQTGFLCKLGDTACLAETISKLMTDKSVYQKVSRSAISWSKNFSWSKSTRASLKLIQKL